MTSKRRSDTPRAKGRRWRQGASAEGAYRCRTGKRAYRDEQQAKNAITRIRQVGEKRDTSPERAYSCEFCGRWHLTSDEVQR